MYYERIHLYLNKPVVKRTILLFVFLTSILSSVVHTQNTDSLIQIINHSKSFKDIKKAKQNLPAHLQKVDMKILDITRQMRVQGIEKSNISKHKLKDRYSSDIISLDNNGYFHSEVYLNQLDNNIVDKLKASGVIIEYTNQNFKQITCRIPFDVVESIAKDENVVGIYNVGKPYFNIGTYTTAGDQILNSIGTRSTYGINGQGIKVGVISDGVDNWTSARDAGDLPSNFEVINNRHGGNEGTALSEIVYDVAPGASLAFSDADSTQAGFNERINDLVAHGCKVIVDDIGYYDERMFEDGPIAQHVDYITSTYGIKYISSAGNSGKQTWNGMGVDANSNGWMEFSGSDETNTFLMPPRSEITVVLQWANQYLKSSDDYDLGLYETSDPNGNWFGKSTNIQNGTGNPYEIVRYANNSTSNLVVYIRVALTLVQTPREVKLIVFSTKQFDYSMQYYTNGGIIGHAAASSCISVGAINAAAPQTIAYYSSKGPSRIYSYDSNGNPVSYVDRATPTICGIDGVQTYIGTSGMWSGGNPLFYGTSAAAPHVAGISALILALPMYSSLNWQQVTQKLTSTATKVSGMGGQNFTNAYGYGRVDAFQSEKNAYVNATVASGTNFQVNPGASFSFHNGASLIVNGTLNANGNSASTPITFDFISPNSSTQNGIVFNSGSGSSTISYCKVLNAYRGIYENGVSVNISNSAMSNCTNGIYLYSSNPIVQNTNIHDNTYGIYLTSSSPFLYNNFIRYNSSMGVYCSTSSNPKFGNGSTQGKNNIVGNNQGVYCWNNSYPILGKNSPLDGGYNNLVNTSYNVYNMSGGSIYAHNNWWGSTTPANFKIGGTGSVLYNPYRSSSVIVNTPPLSKSSGNPIASDYSNIPMLSELDKAYQLIAENNLAGARTICLNLVSNYPDYNVSYNALNLLKETYLSNEISSSKNIYKSLFNTKGKKNLYAMAGLILADIDKENKLKQIDEVINSYKGESVVELALFDKFIYYIFDKDDRQNGLLVSQELDKRFPLSQGAIEAHRILGDPGYDNIEVNKNQPLEKTVAQAPTDNSLLGNYPNPFNPTTVISYQLSAFSKVSLKVYDILGREVTALVDGMKDAGYYTTQFDGSNLASGVYFTRFVVTPQDGNQPIVQLKKMLLMK